MYNNEVEISDAPYSLTCRKAGLWGILNLILLVNPLDYSYQPASIETPSPVYKDYPFSFLKHKMQSIILLILLAFKIRALALAPSAIVSESNPKTTEVLPGYTCYNEDRYHRRLQFADCAKLFTSLYNSELYSFMDTFEQDSMPAPYRVPREHGWSRVNPCTIELRSSLREFKESLSIAQILHAAMELIQLCHRDGAGDLGAGGLMQVGSHRGFHVVLHSSPF